MDSTTAHTSDVTVFKGTSHRFADERHFDAELCRKASNLGPVLSVSSQTAVF